jgi:serine protease Do
MPGIDSESHEEKTAYQAPPVVAWEAIRREAKTFKMPQAVAVLALLFGLFGGIVGSFTYVRFFAQYIPADKKQLVVEESSATVSVANKVSPAVVSITSQAVSQGFFGTQQQTEGAGTGMIVSSDGLILTNRHVVSDTSATYTVVTSTGKTYPATVVSRDSENDIAFVRIAATGLPTVQLGDSSSVEVGDSVIAIGNALGQFQNTVTTGVVSGLSRAVTASDDSGLTNSSEQLENVFQTDAAINPGNSGGPLVNLDGQVIGMNTAIAGQGSQNIGFAIPINDVKPLIASVENSGKIIRAYLGVEYVSLDPGTAQANNLSVSNGAWVQSGDPSTPSVVSGSPADKAGVKDGDVITSVNGKAVDENDSLQSLISNYKPGQTVTLGINRSGSNMTLKVTLGEAPGE